jgi:hypothetical protein
MEDEQEKEEEEEWNCTLLEALFNQKLMLGRWPYPHLLHLQLLLLRTTKEATLSTQNVVLQAQLEVVGRICPNETQISSI